MSTATLPTPPPPSPATPPGPRWATLADLLADLGDVPSERVWLRPTPGTATEADVVRIVDGDDKRLVELVENTLVEKPVGVREALLAAAIIEALRGFVRPRNLGIVLGADAMLRMGRGNIRLPDVTYTAWADLPGGTVPETSVGRFPATVAVEVLSASNRKREMHRKREEYFASGTAVVWEFDPATRTVAVYTPADANAPATRLGAADTLEGGAVLPGFKLPLAPVFAELDIAGPGV
ncbi:MAG TPA: Uma2 family endonuclease [Tepidisphaeraceae bacterium]|nr:Uma2 family endonuclease [Tepidisphaeraceae bacterium]